VRSTQKTIRVGTPFNLWGAESADMPIASLPGVGERSFCILYPDPTVDRLSALTAILTYDKLGYAEIALLLADPNGFLMRTLDFAGFASLRGKLSARLVIITWSPRLALLATWWRFPVAQTVKHYSARWSGQPSGGVREFGWLPSLLHAFARYVRVCWLGRTPCQAPRTRAGERR
jgi:hypothetical protein